MNSENSKTKSANTVRDCWVTDHFPDARKMVETRIGNPVEIDGVGTIEVLP